MTGFGGGGSLHDRCAARPSRACRSSYCDGSPDSYGPRARPACRPDGGCYRRPVAHASDPQRWRAGDCGGLCPGRGPRDRPVQAGLGGGRGGAPGGGSPDSPCWAGRRGPLGSHPRSVGRHSTAPSLDEAGGSARRGFDTHHDGDRGLADRDLCAGRPHIALLVRGHHERPEPPGQHGWVGGRHRCHRSDLSRHRLFARWTVRAGNPRLCICCGPGWIPGTQLPARPDFHGRLRLLVRGSVPGGSGTLARTRVVAQPGCGRSRPSGRACHPDSRYDLCDRDETLGRTGRFSRGA